MILRTLPFFPAVLVLVFAPLTSRAESAQAGAGPAPPAVLSGLLSSSVVSDAPGAQMKPMVSVDLGAGIKMDLVLIPAGSFQMGSNHNDYDEAPAHRVTLTRPYYIGKYEVTQAQWETVMGENPSHFRGSDRPVENVSWEDAQRFIEVLRKKTGRLFALPTEAQWEFACRAGTTTTYSFGDDDSQLEEYAWYASNSDLKTHPVGQKKPNPWGLYDMHGNVFEWCADWYSEAYDNGDAADPTGAATGDRRTIRGGAWLYVSDNLRSSDRGFSPPDYRINEYGLRCVLLTQDAPVLKAQTPTAKAAPSAAPTPEAQGADPAAALFAQLDVLIAEQNKYSSESLLAEIEKLAPGDARADGRRAKIAALPAPNESLALDVAPGVRMEFILIRPGTFIMGSDQDAALDEKPAHRVTITRPYYLGKYEVTQKQWVALMNRNLSTFKGNPQFSDPSTLPVENVSWLLCQEFLSKLRQQNPGYEFRLPTEAEWEYACRAGTTGDDVGASASLDDQAWYGSNSGGETHPVGGKRPNAWGLYDMYGNVWEWCQDEYARYPRDAVSDPVGQGDGSSPARVTRGGAWNATANHVNATFRHDVDPDTMMRYYGFRCVAVPTPTQKEPAR